MGSAERQRAARTEAASENFMVVTKGECEVVDGRERKRARSALL